MNYINYSTEDFVTDDYFRQWVQHPDENNQKFWKNWIQQHPDKLETINEARDLLGHLNFKVAQPEPEDIQEVRKIIHEGIEKPVVPFPVSSEPKNGEWQRQLFKSAAALVAGITLLGLVYFYLINDELTTYTTQLGETQHIVLPDSSTVILNANSTLSLSSNWQHDREVWLTGEAYFSVQKQQEEILQDGNLQTWHIKFTVHTADVEVEVLGTRFNVNERSGTTKVVLNSGRVQLKNTTNEDVMQMKPGDLVAFSKADKNSGKRS